MPKVMHPTVSGRFLTPDDVDDGTIVTIAGAGEYKPSQWNPNRLELPIVPHSPPEWITGGNMEKIWGLNQTTESTLCSGIEDEEIAGYGETTEEWIGKKAKINKVKQMVGKNMKMVLYGEPLEGETLPTVTPKAKPTTTPPATEETPPYTEEEVVWVRYHELLINTIIDPEDWQRIPKAVKNGLQAKGVLTDKNGYPFLTEGARKALE